MNFDRDFLQSMLAYLYDAGIQSVLVEGGRMLLESFIQGNLWDEARVFKGTGIFGAGVTAPEIPADAARRVCYSGGCSDGIS